MSGQNNRQLVEEMLASQPLGVLATSDEGRPHASLIAYASLAGMKEIVFATPRATRKFEYLSQRPQVALLVDNRSNQESDFQQAAAVTAYGQAREVGEADREQYFQALTAKHPYLRDFVKASTTALIVIRVSQYSMVTRFQKVIDLMID